MTRITRQTFTIQNALISSISATGHVRPEAECDLTNFAGNGNDKKTFRRVLIT